MVAVFLMAIIVALVVEEVSGISPAGVVPAGYLALCLGDWALLATTLGLAAAVYGGLLLAERGFVLYGRRRLAFAILLSAVLKGLLVAVAPGLAPVALGAAGLLGAIVPGIMADWSLRQGVAPTAASLAFAVAVVALARLGLGW